MTTPSWWRQPTTITGLATLGALAVGLVTHALTADPKIASAVGTAVFVGAHLLVNDNTAVAADAEKLAVDAASGATGYVLAGDATKVATDMATAPGPAKT